MCLRGSRFGFPRTVWRQGEFPVIPVSSRSSLRTASFGSSPSSTNPPGKAHAPFQGSFPRLIRRTSVPFSPSLVAIASTAREGFGQMSLPHASQRSVTESPPESTSTILIGFDSGIEVSFREGWPEYIGEIEFRICRLPE